MKKKSASKRIPVDQAGPGMVLAGAVVNRDGRRLLDPGISLSAKEIRILKMWGIPEIQVRPDSGSPDPTPDQIMNLGNEKAVRFFEKWFGNNRLDNPVIQAVYDICLDRYVNGRFDVAPVFRADRKAAMTAAGKIRPDNSAIDLLAGDIKLPSLPTIFSEITEAVKDPKCSGKDIAEIVSKDPSLSATLLKIVNSAYYGLAERVESLNYAAMALGSRQVSSLALGITVVNHFKGIDNPKADMESFWRHSVATAIAAKTLAGYLEGVDPERVFIGGLLHDIGWLVFLHTCPEECNQVFHKSRMLGVNLFLVEKKYFGLTHAEFGSRLAENWNLSENLTALIRCHHDRFRTPPSREVAVVYAANWLMDAIGIGFSGEQMMPRLDMAAWDALGVSPSVISPTVKQVDRQVMETVRFFHE